MTISILEKAHIPLQKIQSERLNIIAGGAAQPVGKH